MDEGHGERYRHSGERELHGEGDTQTGSPRADPGQLRKLRSRDPSHTLASHFSACVLSTPSLNGQINLVSNKAIVNPDWIASTIDWTNTLGVPDTVGVQTSSLTLDVGAVWCGRPSVSHEQLQRPLWSPSIMT